MIIVDSCHPIIYFKISLCKCVHFLYICVMMYSIEGYLKMCNAVNLFVHSLVCSLLLPSFYRSRKEASEHRMLLFLFYTPFADAEGVFYIYNANTSSPIRPALSSSVDKTIVSFRFASVG